MKLFTLSIMLKLSPCIDISSFLHHILQPDLLDDAHQQGVHVVVQGDPLKKINCTILLCFLLTIYRHCPGPDQVCLVPHQDDHLGAEVP